MKRLLLLSSLLALWPAFGSAADFKIIVNKANPATELSASEVAAMLTKRTTKWADGTAVVPVDQVESSPVRAAFSSEVLRKPTAAVKSYWRQQIFGGLDTPPVEKLSDSQVIEFVRANRGAIGYVSSTSPLENVKVVSIH
ncbi:MAG TPA: substrate-binding domain-containing protein [Thermoanaerobaculia bacterium]